MLPHIAGRLRLLWSLSPFFGAAERMTGLLRRFCSQIIAVCTRAISVADALSGDVDAVIRKLQVSCHAPGLELRRNHLLQCFWVSQPLFTTPYIPEKNNNR